MTQMCFIILLLCVLSFYHYVVYHSINGVKEHTTFNLGQVYNNISRWCYSKMEPKKAESIDNPYVFMETAPGKIMGLSAYGNKDKVDDTLADKYRKHEHGEHILELPDTYIGSVENVDAVTWVCKDNKIVKNYMIYIPGLYKLFDEGIVNCRANMKCLVRL